MPSWGTILKSAQDNGLLPLIRRLFSSLWYGFFAGHD